MAQAMVPVSQIEEVAQRVFQEQAERLRQELLQEVAARAPRRSEAEERVWEAIHELAEAQARTEKRVEELAQAQARTEERVGRLEAAVERLAEAQARTEERVGRLEAAVERLAEAQARTEERVTRLEAAVEKLAQAQARTEKALAELSRHVGYLSNILGADLEVDAEEVLRYAMQQKGYRLLGPARPVEIDGEIDVALPVENPAGQRLWAVVEAKTRVREKEVEKWSHRFKSARFLQRLNKAGIAGPYLPYIFGLRVYSDVLPSAEKAGVGILDFRGEQVEALVIS